MPPTRRRAARLALTTAAIAVVASCTVLNPLDRYQAGLGEKNPSGNDGGLDGGVATLEDGGGVLPDGAPATPRCTPTKPFGAPVPLDEVNSTVDDLPSGVSLDELTLYFSSTRDGPGVSLYRATRPTPDEKWGSVASLFPKNAWDDWSVAISPDGKIAVVASDRPGGGGGGVDLFVATRNSTFETFTSPAPAAALNTAGAEQSPHWTMDGNTLYFDRTVDAGREIFRSAVIGQTFAPAEELTELSVSSFNGTPVLSKDELTIYFASNRSPTTDDGDIYVATRSSKTGTFSNPTRLDDVSSDGAVDAPAYLTPDGCRLYMGSMRKGDGHFHMYVAARPK